MEIITCDVCSEDYKTEVRDPLVLPCGHTYCSSCVLRLYRHGNVKCPGCRTKHRGLDIKSLPINYAVVSILAANNKDYCTAHGDSMSLWCRDCEFVGCGVCMFNLHPKTHHDVVCIVVMLEERKREAVRRVKTLLDTSQNEVERIAGCINKVQLKALKYLRERSQLESLVKQLGSILDRFDGNTRLVSMDALDDEISTLQDKVESTCGRLVQGCSPQVEYENQCLDGAMTVPSGMGVSMCGGRESRLVWLEDRLLLHTTTASSSQRQPVKLVAVERLVASNIPEVFLELSVNELVLGTVYIRLWGRLRRAQHFLALCLGTLGPSFLEARLMYVISRGDSDETVNAGDYVDLNGITCSSSLIDGLEWDGKYAGERREGLVIASSGGEPRLDARFAICTNKHATGRVRCPFGEVVAGLDVVRASMSFVPQCLVRISGCGYVLQQKVIVQAKAKGSCSN